MFRLWNSEVPISPKWDMVDLFSGTGQVKARVYTKTYTWHVSTHIFMPTQAAWVSRGFTAAAHDIELHPSLNFLHAAGFACVPELLSAGLLVRELPTLRSVDWRSIRFYPSSRMGHGHLVQLKGFVSYRACVSLGCEYLAGFLSGSGCISRSARPGYGFLERAAKEVSALSCVVLPAIVIFKTVPEHRCRAASRK